MSLSMEQYYKDIQSLPAELRRKYNRMRELDTIIEKLMKKIDSDSYLRNINSLSPQNKEFHINKIQRLNKNAKEYNERKIQLAIESYDLVDKLVCHMDSYLKRSTTGLLIAKKPKPAKPKKVTIKTKKKKKPRKRRKMYSSDEDFDIGRRKKKRKKQLWTKAGASSTSASEGEEDAQPPALVATNHENTYNIPVDPNEPTFCLCRQVSYGEMIGCDNPGCAIEWFHFPCVGLITKPKGNWYCRRCTVERKVKIPETIKYYCTECFEELNISGEVKI